MLPKLKELRAYLATWLDHHKRATEIAPAIREMFETVDWQVETLSDRPAGAQHTSTRLIEEQAGLELEHIQRTVPQMAFYQPVVATTTSSVALTYSHICTIADDLGTPEAQVFASDARDSYHRMQESHHRADQVRGFLVARFPTCVDRFDSALHAYQQHNVGTGTPTAAALEMRTLIDGVLGELLETARKVPKEKLNWATMSERLTSDMPSRTLMVNQETVRAKLYSDLSEVAKARSSHDVRDLWTRTLDHLHTVLTLTT